MNSFEVSTDKIFTRGHFTIYYRRARGASWSSEARPVYTVLFLLEGEWRWSADDKEAGEPHTRGGGGSVLLVNPGASIHARGEHVAYLALTLAPVFVLDCAVRARLIRADALVAFRAQVIEEDERLARLADDLAHELVSETTGQEVVVAAIIEQIVVHLLRRYATIRRSDELELSRAGLIDRRIRRAVELMHVYLDRELPLEEIAAAAYLSPFHFARLFKKLTGASPHTYLAALRVARAQTLLAETDLSITEVGARVGYASSSHFAKTFRQATGLSPRAFRTALIQRQTPDADDRTGKT